MMDDEDDQHVHDLVGAYVLGAVTEDEAALVTQHLATCAACRQLESALREVERMLPHLAGEMEPPPGLKARLMAVVTAEAATPGAAPPLQLPLRPDALDGRRSLPPASAAPTPEAGAASVPRPEGMTPPQQIPEPGAAHSPQPITEAEGVTPLRPAPIPFVERRERRAVRFSPLLAVAAALIVAVVGAGVWRALSGTSPQPSRVYAMGGAAMPGISGKLTYYKDGQKLVLNLTGLRGIPSSRVYELWLVHTQGSAIVKALGVGEFRPAGHGRGQLTLSGAIVPANMTYYNVAALTVERAPGSLTPTLPIVALGKAASA